MIRPKDKKSKYLNGKDTTQIEHKNKQTAFEKSCYATDK